MRSELLCHKTVIIMCTAKANASGGNYKIHTALSDSVHYSYLFLQLTGFSGAFKDLRG